MIRELQVISNKNIDAQYKVASDLKRGTIVTKDYANKTLVPATSLEGFYILDRGLICSPMIDVFGTPSDYEEILENVKAGEFGLAIEPLKGERYAITEYDGADADLAVGKYLTVTNGKLVKTVEKTNIKSIGYVDDNGHKLLGFEILA